MSDVPQWNIGELLRRIEALEADVERLKKATFPLPTQSLPPELRDYRDEIDKAAKARTADQGGYESPWPSPPTPVERNE